MNEEQLHLLVKLMDEKCYEAVTASCSIMLSVVNAIASQPGVDIEQLTLAVMTHLRAGADVMDPGVAKRCALEMADIINISYRVQLNKA